MDGDSHLTFPSLLFCLCSDVQSEALSWKVLQREVAKRCQMERKDVEAALWLAMQQQRKRMTFGSRAKRKAAPADEPH